MKQYERQGAGCADAAPLLDAYASGELGDDARACVRRHLDGCPACAADLDATARLRSLVRRAVRGESVPEGLGARIRETLRKG